MASLLSDRGLVLPTDQAPRLTHNNHCATSMYLLPRVLLTFSVYSVYYLGKEVNDD